MKKSIRNIFIIIFYLTGIPFLRRQFLRKPLLRVWTLHKVPNDQVEQFKTKLSYLKNKYNIITPQQFLENDFSKKKLNILVTFDDGDESWFANVLPVLRKEQVKAIFFINQAFYIRAGELEAAGHSLGGHSLSHKRLTEIKPEELEQEVWQSQKSEFFAYPYGDKNSFNINVIAEVKKAGFMYGFTILPNFNNPSDSAGKKKTDALLMHRDSLDPDLPDFIFQLWFKGCYDWLKQFSD